MTTRSFTLPLIIIVALLALTTLTYRVTPLVLWAYHMHHANQFAAAGLIWSDPRYVDSMPQVSDALLLDQAAEHLTAAMQYRPYQARAYRLAGQIALAQGQPEQALAVLEQGRTLAPDNDLLAWDTSLVYAQIDQAMPDYETAMLKTWRNTGFMSEALISQAEYARLEQRYDAARVWCQRAVLLDPYNGHAWSKMGQVETHRQNYEQSLAAYERAAALLPHDRDVWYYLGLAYVRVKQPQPALVAYEQGLNATTGSIGLSNLYHQIGNLKLTAGQPRDLAAASSAYEQALRLDDYVSRASNRSETYRQRGMLLVRQQRLDEALQQFEAALALYPENYWAHLAMAQTLWDLDRQAEALTWANTAIELRPDLKHAYSLLGRLYTESGDIVAARAMYQKVLDLDPQDKAAHQALEALDKASE